MKVGDYVRTKNGLIAKYIGYDNEYKWHLFDGKIQWFYEYYRDYIDDDGWEDFKKEEVLKSSPNIIDLIEVGDFVTYKNGNYYFKIPTRVCGLFDELTLSTIKIVGDNILNEVEITSILTKEQFESMEYKIGE